MPPSKQIFYAPNQLMAQGDYVGAGRWAVAFQINRLDSGKDWNNVMICSSGHGCGSPYQAPQDQFLPAVAISGGPSYWLSFLMLREDLKTDLLSWFIAPGQYPAGAAFEQGIDTLGWSQIQRCPQLCYAAGDFMALAALSSSKASAPFIQSISANSNIVKQDFLLAPAYSGDQPISISGVSAAPVWQTFPLGTDFKAQGKPHGMAGPPPGLRIRNR